MKKRTIKFFTAIALLALTIFMFAACNNNKAVTHSYDDGVVKAFNSVTSDEKVVSQTAVAEEQGYLVTVITPTSVSQYNVDKKFKVGEVDSIVDGASTAKTVAAEVARESDLQRAYREALKLSNVSENEVRGFDFDKDTYMGKAVFKVEIEDDVAEYSYIFDASDLSLIQSKAEITGDNVSGSYIGEERAEEIALEATGADKGRVVVYKTFIVLNNGKKIYKVKFDDNHSGYRFEVDIDALNGDIVKYSKTILDAQVTGPEIAENITVDEAKDIARAFVTNIIGQDASIAFGKVKPDYEDGRFIYEIEIETERGADDRTHTEISNYEFEILASDGTILDVEIDTQVIYAVDDVVGGGTQTKQFITRDEAVRKVLEKAGSNALVLDVELEKEHTGSGKTYYYEVEVKVDGREVEYYVDALTGEVTLNDDYSGNTAVPSVGEDEALRTALESFGLAESELSFKKIKLEREDGRLCYEVKLYAGNVEYSMSIDATNGKILEREVEEQFDQADDVPPQASDLITREQAIEAVKKVAGANARIDADDVELDAAGTGEERYYYYEVEAEVNGREYEYIVDAVTGEARLKGEYVENGQSLIGEDRAIAVALQYFSLTADEAKVYKVKLEEEDGVLVYEVELRVKSIEYTVEIDAQTGKVLESDISYD